MNGLLLLILIAGIVSSMSPRIVAMDEQAVVEQSSTNEIQEIESSLGKRDRKNSVEEETEEEETQETNDQQLAIAQHSEEVATTTTNPVLAIQNVENPAKIARKSNAGDLALVATNIENAGKELSAVVKLEKQLLSLIKNTYINIERLLACERDLQEISTMPSVTTGKVFFRTRRAISERKEDALEFAKKLAVHVPEELVRVIQKDAFTSQLGYYAWFTGSPSATQPSSAIALIEHNNAIETMDSEIVRSATTRNETIALTAQKELDAAYREIMKIAPKALRIKMQLEHNIAALENSDAGILNDSTLIVLNETLSRAEKITETLLNSISPEDAAKINTQILEEAASWHGGYLSSLSSCTVS